MKKFWLSIALLSIVLLAACGGDDESTNDSTTGSENGTETASVDGEAVAKQKCVSCHGGNFEGQGNFPALNDVGSRYSEEEILDIILKGKGRMPGGIIKGEDAEAVAAYFAEMK